MISERIETDVLCVGGGITGLMASIRAAEMGANVIIVEKGNTLRSGEGRAGNDHFWCYIPEAHGPDINEFINECLLTQLGEFVRGLGPKTMRAWLEKSFDIVKLWDEWGIPMKYQGKWEFAGHSFPGRMLTHLKYSGINQKPIILKQALKRGVRVMNRIMIFDLLGDANGVTGALGIDTREDRLFEFQAKSVILGTGAVTRLYPNSTPGLIGNDSRPITTCGDGRAMAYRLGAELTNLESVNRHIGVGYYLRSGQATWVGIYEYPDGKPIGKYLTKADRKYGDILPEVDKNIFSKIIESGRGPVYMNCTSASPEDLEYMKYWLNNEGNQGLLKHLEEEGINLAQNPVEFRSYPVRGGGRIWADETTRTSVQGLYAGGEEAYATISSAAVFGWIAGENAAGYVKGGTPAGIDKESFRIEEQKNFLDSLQSRKQGPDWRDANMALQNTMLDYCGPIRSEAMLTAGLNRLRILKQKMNKTLMARNRWELTRCLEVINLFDIGELVFLTALERKESRGLIQRADYPLIDPLLNGKTLIVKKVDGKPAMEWREMGTR